MKKIAYILTGVIVLAGCKPRLPIDTPSSGAADVSVYVAVGNSLTAGYADNSLYRKGQQNSYPNILATQFALVGGGDFKQPLLPGEWGYPDAKLVLGMKTNCAGIASLGPVSYTGWADTVNNAMSIANSGPYNNLGVPGIRTVDYLLNNYATLAQTVGNAGYASRFFKQPGKRPLDELIYTVNTLKPTFFTLWLGANDVLGYATSGGEGAVPGTPVFGLILPGDISPTDMFQKNYDSVVNVLVKDGARGVLLNIPDITAIPLFTTVPIKGLELDAVDAVNLANLHAAAGLQFAEGTDYYVVADAGAAGGRRKIREGEYILLSSPLTDSIKCGGWGKTKPIPEANYLDAEEVAHIKTATATFNQVILLAAQKHGLAHVDMNHFLNTVTTGYKFNGAEFTTEYISGGAFSLDGVHLTPRGYAIVANEIINAINLNYGARIPMADVNSYNGLLFP